MDKFVFKGILAGTKTIVITKDIFCPLIVQSFYDFLVGCGYHPKNVMDAFEDVASEHRETYLDADRK